MSYIRCPKGHYYDNEKHAACPHCKSEGSMNANAPAPTSAYTEAVPKETAALNKTGTLEQEKTLAEEILNVKNNKPQVSEEEKTIGVFSTPEGVEPVVGWLVITEGADKGLDYRLIAGRNFIGRASGMNVILAKDKAVSASKHAIIVYDPNENIFIAMPGESHELFYRNGKVVLEPTVLNIGDRLKIGHTTMMFIPCCGESFVWDVQKADS